MINLTENQLVSDSM